VRCGAVNLAHRRTGTYTKSTASEPRQLKMNVFLTAMKSVVMKEKTGVEVEML